MAEKVDICVTLDLQVKEEFERVCEEMGLTIQEAIEIFVKETVRRGKIPFEISTEDLW